MPKRIDQPAINVPSVERVKTSIYMPETLYIRLKVQAARERAPMTDLILEAVERLLSERQEGKETSV